MSIAQHDLVLLLCFSLLCSSACNTNPVCAVPSPPSQAATQSGSSQQDISSLFTRHRILGAGEGESDGEGGEGEDHGQTEEEEEEPLWWTHVDPQKGWVLSVAEGTNEEAVRSPRKGATARIVDDDRVPEDIRGAQVQITELLDKQGLIVNVVRQKDPVQHPITLSSDLLVFTQQVPKVKSEHVMPLPILHRIIREAATDMEAVLKLRELSPGFSTVIDEMHDLWATIDVSLPVGSWEAKHQAEVFYRKCIRHGNPKAALCLSLLYHYGYRCPCHKSPWAPDTSPHAAPLSPPDLTLTAGQGTK